MDFPEMAKVFFLGGFSREFLVWGVRLCPLVQCLNCMKTPAGFSDVGECVSEGEMVLCDDYGVGVLGARAV